MTIDERAVKIAREGGLVDSWAPRIATHLREVDAIAWDAGCVEGQKKAFPRGFHAAREKAAGIASSSQTEEGIETAGRIREMEP